MVSMDPLAHPWNRLIWACISYGSQMANNVTFGSVFGHGFKTSVVIACITVVFTVISLTLIFPDTKEIALDQARKQMEEQGKPEQVIDQGMEIARKGFMTFAILGVVVFTLLVGAIASLIGAAVTKKNPVTPFGNQP
jgi:NADH:ubiquinone oxidoreductase subunit 6 (subunit J)